MYISGMRTFSVAETRSSLAEALETVATEPVAITRHGKPVAVILEPGIYERLLDAFEELEDVRAFDDAQIDGDSRIPWLQVKQDLGLA